MNMKTRWITWVITISAFFDVIYGVINDNAGVLTELGVSPKANKIILLVGVLWTAFSKSLAHKPQGIASDEVDAIISPKPPRP